MLIAYAMQRRWFRGKGRKQKAVTVSDAISFEGPHRFAIVLLQVEYDHGPAEKYVVPLAFARTPIRRRRCACRRWWSPASK